MKNTDKLTDIAIRKAKPTDKTGNRLADGQGLYLHVTDAGRYWRMGYRFAEKKKVLSIGVYPEVTLAQARVHRREARALLAQGIDPSAAKRARKVAGLVLAANTFEASAREFHITKRDAWSPDHAARWLRRMEKDLFPYIGKMPLPEVTAPILLAALRRVESRGVGETVHSLKQSAGQVFRYGIQTGRCERNPVPDLAGALKPITVTHMAAVLEPAKAGELLRAIDGYGGQPVTRAALQLSALLFQRPGNIRAMQWSWIDFDAAVLTIPAGSMKRTVQGKTTGRPHFVPLADQALVILRELHPLTGHGIYVFPSLRTGERPMSENTVNAALRRMGYSTEDMTAHGFRAMARTIMSERMKGIAPDVVEAQLAHGKSGPLGMAYDRAEYMEQRVKMMRAWADYLDQLRRGADVVRLHA